METKFVISQELAQAIANYLVQRPYREVFELLAQLQQIKPVEIKENAEANS